MRDDAALRSRLRVAARLEDEYKRTCTFKPDIHPPPPGVTEHAPLRLRVHDEPETVTSRIEEYVKVSL
jgi:hypothetical protein